MKKRKGEFVAEDRLWCTLMWNGGVQPICMIVYGLTLQYWHGAGGLAFALVIQAVASFSMVSPVWLSPGIMFYLTLSNFEDGGSAGL